ncbi:HAD hydrolase family protein [Brucepastera parasyntrophica]|uniref:HAD family hydrolase n=1 Tax=Brucepastera parasyntrophica TaxID=2880008 RepID=UPI00210F142F|nr:HAD hydrolase family protein [Brucepastera parasyntrophica]ULQ58716.1 HAD hydrolase family protein [Brucepastera parasyntrophica]
MKPIQTMPAETARSIKWIFSDIDDTITKDNKIVPDAYRALCDLKKAGFKVFVITGRSAGWGQIHLQEWPIDGAIAENGAISYCSPEYSKGRDSSCSPPVAGEPAAHEASFDTIIHPSAVRNNHPALLRAAQKVYETIPCAKPALDNRFRLYDYAVDHAEYVSPPLSEADVASIVRIFKDEGCMAKASSIHVNAWFGTYNKLEAALQVLTTLENYTDSGCREQVLFVGDAPNDESMFEHFPNACAVANIDIWKNSITHFPSWVSAGRYGEGFAEIADYLLFAARV